ncbi:phosphoribosylaminoimidazolesuccinocarboxamide synthase [Amycolatopsis thailandensis]|uniref:phosphoribosylaminoimidazolesuccinocarboxamide synthase n=1 Tax=Amycolatopsis thailandensis TaxID=589330 RepID=A0A229RUB1_9PSEU|nr:phosphoribosylaminoimidazolesuccinocarboxamide synthase [Amycolatopsis thailandensis]OXM50277.1 phosphoribosylaminoimidazolesuccinocarboxamide synthase [Amycolatopsis thailandensis]
MSVLHSTKDLRIVRPPTPEKTGVGIFDYTDHYTVFHYGRMPDTIPGKGEATCRMAAATFAMLEAAGVRTHFRRVLPPTRIEFDLARDPATTGGPPTARDRAHLLPIQVIVRTQLPQGSSVHRRLATGATTLAQLGLTTLPAPGEPLREPIVEYATTRDPVNRFLDPADAQRLTGLDTARFSLLRRTALTVTRLLTRHARDRGITYADGTFEFLIDHHGSPVLADSPGTPDESRLLAAGVHCGKQLLRNWYTRNHLAIPVTQLIADRVPRDQWPRPARLPPEFLPVMSDLYQALADTWTDQPRGDAPDLPAAARRAAGLIDTHRPSATPGAAT